MNDIKTLKRNDISPMSGDVFKAGDKFKFLGLTGYGVRLSRIGDNAKLGVVAADIGYGEIVAEPTEEEKEAALVFRKSENEKYEAIKKHYATPHSDESGESRFVETHSVLAGKDSGVFGIHLTPAEEREYNRGMALMAE